MNKQSSLWAKRKIEVKRPTRFQRFLKMTKINPTNLLPSLKRCFLTSRCKQIGCSGDCCARIQMTNTAILSVNVFQRHWCDIMLRLNNTIQRSRRKRLWDRK